MHGFRGREPPFESTRNLGYKAPGILAARARGLYEKDDGFVEREGGAFRIFTPQIRRQAHLAIGQEMLDMLRCFARDCQSNRMPGT